MEHEVCCERCQTAYLLKDIKLSQSGNHLRADCPMCGRFLKFVRQSEPSGDEVMPFGKHKGEKISDIVTEDNNYAQWASENLKGRFKECFILCLKK